MPEPTRPTRAEIDLGAIAANVRVACGLAGPGAAVMAVVKADAYGHGAIPVAGAALRRGHVARRGDSGRGGRASRGGHSGAHPGPRPHRTGAGGPGRASRSGPVRVRSRPGRGAEPSGRVCRAHAPTPSEGGHRHGPRRRAPARGSRGGGAHRAIPGGSSGGTDDALRRVRRGRSGVHARTVGPVRRAPPTTSAPRAWPFRSATPPTAPHCSITRRAAGPGPAGHHAVRVSSLRPPTPGDPTLVPALRLRTAVSQLKDLPAGGSVSYGRTFVAPRDMRIATLPIGYADGLARLLSGRGHVLVRGRRAPIVGRVCMDMTMVDVTTSPRSASATRPC